VDEISGAKLINSAMIFGVTAVVFSVMPFLSTVIMGIKKTTSNQSPSSANIIGYAILAYSVHVVSCISFMLTILILDALNFSDSNYLRGKVFPIFWSGSSKSAVLSAAGDSGMEASAAATILVGVYKAVAGIFLLTPLLVMIFGVSYGIFQASKDTYREDGLTVIVYSVASVVVAMGAYIAWAKIASFSLFMSGSLYDFNAAQWREIFLNQ